MNDDMNKNGIGQSEVPETETAAEEKTVGTKSDNKLKKSRKWRYGALATVMTVLVVVGVIVINMIVGKLAEVYPLTVDTTEDKTFTLSDESVALAGKIDCDVEVIVFADESTFATPNYSNEIYNTISTQFYMAMQQYQALSGGKVKTSYVDLNKNPTIATKYQAYEVEEGDILFLAGDRAQKISINDLYTATPNQQTYTYDYKSNVEKIIATKINVLCGDGAIVATILTGHSEEESTVSGVTEVLGNNGCEVRMLDITTAEEPAAESTLFVIPAPTGDYSADEVARLREWLENGGIRGRNLIVFTGYTADCPNLFALLNDNYGIEVGNDIVIETSAKNYALMRQYYTYGDVARTDYTAYLTSSRVMSPITRRLILHNENDTSASVYSLPVVTFGETAKLESLAVARGEAQETENPADLLTAADSYPIVGAAYTVTRRLDTETSENYQTSVIVYGSSQFLDADMRDSLPSAVNEEVFVKVFCGVCGVENLINVSSRSLDQKSLDFNSSLTPVVLGIGVFTIGIPIVTLAIALFVFIRRRRL